MLIGLIEHDAKTALLSHIEEINHSKSSAWGLAVIKRKYLRTMTNDAFVLAIKPLLQDCGAARVYCIDGGDIYVLWLGMQKRIHHELSERVSRTMLRDRVTLDPGSIVIYFDPQIMGNEISMLLRDQEKEEAQAPKRLSASAAGGGFSDLPTFIASLPLPTDFLKPSTEELAAYRSARARKASRKQLDILVVEDQQLLRRLMQEVLRGNYTVDAAAGMQEGWKLYLEKAPDIAFLDIGLMDGNGHVLAHAIKRLDPDACVVMVTANNTQEELKLARANQVDGFVIKPYSRQQISSYIDKYMLSGKNGVKEEHA